MHNNSAHQLTAEYLRMMNLKHDSKTLRHLIKVDSVLLEKLKKKFTLITTYVV